MGRPLILELLLVRRLVLVVLLVSGGAMILVSVSFPLRRLSLLKPRRFRRESRTASELLDPGLGGPRAYSANM